MWRCSLAAGGIVLFALVGVTWYAGRETVNFQNLTEAKTFLTSAGFACYSDHVDGDIGTGFLISREPVTTGEVSLLCKVGPMGSKWRGKAWVTFISKDWRLASLPDGAAVREWGGVFAFGDEEVLREVDAARLMASFTR
ncbi:MAG TPA: hypothetical protein VFE62_08770 [Gemmataceae bacterium]|nr:hypothetical protein [Gemmataceae bacterium]